MSVERQSRVRDFWQLPPKPRSDWKGKYRALDELASMAESTSRREKLRDIARFWPGALREAELVSPQVLRERVAACARTAIGELRRAEIAASGGAGWLLASELNDHVQIYGQMRRWARSRGRAWSFEEAYGALGAVEAAAWPPPGSCPGLQEHPPGSRLAYLALAWTAGLSLPCLNRLILDRTGRWDRREHDPAWAHQRGPAQRDPHLALEDLR